MLQVKTIRAIELNNEYIYANATLTESQLKTLAQAAPEYFDHTTATLKEYEGSLNIVDVEAQDVATTEPATGEEAAGLTSEATLDQSPEYLTLSQLTEEDLKQMYLERFGKGAHHLKKKETIIKDLLNNAITE